MTKKDRRNRLAYLSLFYAIQGENELSEKIRSIVKNFDKENPDVDCYTLPNGGCITPGCRLHG